MMMNEAEAAVAIAALPFTDGEKDQLRRARENERDAIFRTIDFRNGVYASLRQWRELKNWVATHEIFLNSSVLRLIRALRDDLHGTLVHAQTYAEDGEQMPLLERVEMDRKLARDFNERIDELAEKIRSRFGFAKRPFVWMEIGAFWGEGKRIVGVLHGLTTGEVLKNALVPVLLKRLQLVEINDVDTYFAELGERASQHRHTSYEVS
jgi:hypothetical protein